MSFNKISKLILIICILSILSCSKSDDPKIYDPYGKISIRSNNEFVFQGGYSIATLMLDSLVSTQLEDFQLVVSYDTNMMIFTDLTVGAAFQCWDNFDFEVVDPDDCGEDCSLKLIKITASKGSSEVSGCDAADGEFSAFPVKMADLRFYITDNRKYECHLSQLYFYWQDCEDNRINLSQSSMQYYSRYVYGCEKNGNYYDSSMLIPPDGSIDADDHIYGVSPDCAAMMAKSAYPITVKNLDFHDGGLSIACASAIDGLLGDVDLNGMPHEIADIDLLTDYIVEGPSVFSQNYSLQYDNADMIMDNAINILDLYYSILRYNNRTMPSYPSGHSLDDVLIKTSYQNVYMQSSHKVYAVYMELSKETSIMVPSVEMEYKVSTRNGRTYILFYNTEGNYISPGLVHLLSYNGSAELLDIKLCSEYATMLPTYTVPQ